MGQHSPAADTNTIPVPGSGGAVDPCRSGYWVKGWAKGETVSLEKLFTIADVDYAYSFAPLDELKDDTTALLASVLDKYLGRNEVKKIRVDYAEIVLVPIYLYVVEYSACYDASATIKVYRETCDKYEKRSGEIVCTQTRWELVNVFMEDLTGTYTDKLEIPVVPFERRTILEIANWKTISDTRILTIIIKRASKNERYVITGKNLGQTAKRKLKLIYPDYPPSDPYYVDKFFQDEKTMEKIHKKIEEHIRRRIRMKYESVWHDSSVSLNYGITCFNYNVEKVHVILYPLLLACFSYDGKEYEIVASIAERKSSTEEYP